jgi:signal transduction histidine kinase
MDLAPEKLVEEKISAEQIRDPSFWKEFYEQAQVQIRRITELLTDLVSASESNGPQAVEEVDLKQTVKRSLQRFNGKPLQNGIIFIDQIPEGLPKLSVERQKFEHLFELLLKGELISLPAGSRVFLSARSRFEEDQFENNEEVDIQIRDDGPGLPKEPFRAVFDPSFLRSNNFQEFAINLMACYFIVYHHGGKIDVQSEEGHGVTFTLTFPVRPKIVSPADEQETFITKVLINERFWEKLISRQNV